MTSEIAPGENFDAQSSFYGRRNNYFPLNYAEETYSIFFLGQIFLFFPPGSKIVLFWTEYRIPRQTSVYFDSWIRLASQNWMQAWSPQRKREEKVRRRYVHVFLHVPICSYIRRRNAFGGPTSSASSAGPAFLDRPPAWAWDLFLAHFLPRPVPNGTGRQRP